MKKLVKATVQRFGRLDYIFNNAGIVIGGGVDLYGIADWHKVIDVNIRGVVNGIQAAYQIMRAQGFGHIVNTASMAGLMPGPGNTVYTMTKHGIVGLSLSLRGEAALMGVRVSVVYPHMINSAGGAISPDSEDRDRNLETGEVADLVAFICSAPAHVAIGNVTIWPLGAHIAGSMA